MASDSITNPSPGWNNIYCSSRRNRLKHGHRSVAFHSQYEESNESAFSGYIRNEQNMHHTQRKSFKLPCGKTVAQSWAGLRKSWLGFKIALSKGDRYRVRHYALFINKVQREMGIDVTEFDSDILDEQETNDEIGVCALKEDEVPNDDADERSPDYDAMMTEAHGKLNRNCERIAVPRQNIFVTGNQRNRNSYNCPPKRVKDISHAIGTKIRNEYRKSCVHDLGNKQVKAQARSATNRSDVRKSCLRDLKNKQVEHQWRGQIRMEDEDDEPGYFQLSSGEHDTQVSEKMESHQTDEDCTRNSSQYDDSSDIDEEDSDEKERIGIPRRSCTYEFSPEERGWSFNQKKSYIL